jgi:hypothetical protein
MELYLRGATVRDAEQSSERNPLQSSACHIGNLTMMQQIVSSFILQERTDLMNNEAPIQSEAEEGHDEGC